MGGGSGDELGETLGPNGAVQKAGGYLGMCWGRHWGQIGQLGDIWGCVGGDTEAKLGSKKMLGGIWEYAGRKTRAKIGGVGKRL